MIQDCSIKAGFISDHCPVILTLDMFKTMPGSGYWKLNVHLQNLHYVQEINNTLEQMEIRFANCNPLNKWANIIKEVKKSSVSWSKEYAKMKKT